jgi:hypothetical protein
VLLAFDGTLDRSRPEGRVAGLLPDRRHLIDGREPSKLEDLLGS